DLHSFPTRRSSDLGAEEFNFYPSENAITISRTPRGGTILPRNAVEVRPNPQVPGYVPATIDAESVTQVAGRGRGTISIRILNNAAVPDGGRFRIEFEGSADSVRAFTYSLIDDLTGDVPFDTGRDLEGAAS